MSNIRPPVETIVVIAKEPVPGRVKTRLIGTSEAGCAVDAVGAAELARCALTDTLRCLDEIPFTNKVILLDGRPGGWLPSGWTVLAQSGGGLDQRLAAGFAALPPGPALLVGMDTPQLTADLLRFDPSGYDACLGPAADGGYWSIGFADPARARECILGVPMSEAGTGAEQHRRLRAAGLRVQLLGTLTDVDTPATAAQVAAAAPWTGFARRWRQIAGAAHVEHGHRQLLDRRSAAGR